MLCAEIVEFISEAKPIACPYYCNWGGSLSLLGINPSDGSGIVRDGLPTSVTDGGPRLGPAFIEARSGIGGILWLLRS